MNKEWTQRDLDILRRDFPVLPCREIADKLGRTLQAVYVKANKLGLKKEHEGILWTPRMLKMLKDFFPVMFNKPLAKWIGVSERSLIRKARSLGLEKRPGFLVDRRDDILELARAGLKKAYREGRLTSTFKKGERRNPDGEFRAGHVESPETKAKRSASLKDTWRRRKKREQLRQYGIGVNR